MTLRARLVVLAGLIVVVLGVVGPLVVQRQRDVLVDGVDELLFNSWQLTPLSFGEPKPVEPATVDESTPVPASADDDGDAEVVFGETVTVTFDLYVAVVTVDGTTTVQTSGGLLGDRPDLTDVDTRTIDEPTYVTVDGVATDQRFRVLLAPNVDGTVAVLAKPLEPVDSAVRSLIWSIVVGGAAVVALLVVLVWWVVRLGLRPIDQLTEAATAAMNGAGTARVDPPDERTEAGRLGVAFNGMLDQRDRADARLRRFVADASHELRTPLTSVEGYLELLSQAEIDPAEVDGIVRRLRRESHRMRDLVEDLLLLAHLDEGRPMRRDPVDLVGIVRDLAADASVMHPERRIRVVVDDVPVPGDADVEPGAHVVTGDDLRLHQVISGLLGNALVHTPTTADIELHVWTEESGASAVTVQDDGPGVDEATAATLFDRFARGDSSRSRQGDHGGFGLGLAIARSIVEAHGGRLTLATEPGAGCAFTMVLPAAATSGG